MGDYQKGEAHLATDDLLNILVRNRRKLTIDPSARRTQESIEREHQESLVRLLPIKARLAAVDTLIDQIVYRLYGLTEAEIGIVEGKG